MFNICKGRVTEEKTRLGRLKEDIFKNGPGYSKIEGVTSSTIAHLLQNLPSTLSLLSLLSWAHVYDKPTAITRHGSTLEKLQIHAPNCRKSELLTNQQLLPLCNGPPHLRELAIDIGTDKENNDWPWTMFDNIARLPRLQVVRLWFKIGASFENPLAPYLTVDTASQIFSYLHARNNGIRCLELGVSEQCYNIRPYTYWETMTSVSFLCEKPICNDNEGHDSVTITCPDISRGMNEELAILRQRPQEERKRLPDDRDKAALRIALEGPVTKTEWEDWSREILRRDASKWWRFKRLLSKSTPHWKTS